MSFKKKCYTKKEEKPAAAPPYNEPLGVSWTGELVPYHKKEVDTAAANPITGYSNLMYTFHFYAGTHTVSGLGAKVTAALNKSNSSIRPQNLAGTSWV
uniref:Uncharacterized protein n=1 Tax=Globodera pallida TaxID=36090 RepID=A0A183BI83_GLOPA